METGIPIQVRSDLIEVAADGFQLPGQILNRLRNLFIRLKKVSGAAQNLPGKLRPAEIHPPGKHIESCQLVRVQPDSKPMADRCLPPLPRSGCRMAGDGAVDGGARNTKTGGEGCNALTTRRGLSYLLAFAKRKPPIISFCRV